MDRVAERRAVDRLRSAFTWRRDKNDDYQHADVTGWWRSPEIFQDIAAMLGHIVPEPPTVVLGLESRGYLVGVAVALHLHVGFVEVRKTPQPATASGRSSRSGYSLDVHRTSCHAASRAFAIERYL